MGNKHKNHKENQSILRQKISIETSLGKAELTPDAIVQVYIDGKNSILKQVRDLQPGDRVLFKKDKVTTNIDDVNPLLEANLFYRHAREQIFDFYNTEEDNGTLLRKLTLEGLINHGYLNECNEIRTKISQGKKSELTKDEKYISIQGLKEILANNSENKEIPTQTTFNNWINGKSVLTWGKYIPLLSQINPELSDFVEEDGLRKQAYDFWFACRSQVMKTIHHGDWSNGGKEENSSKSNGEKKHKLVVSDIINQIAQNYDENSAIAQIIYTEKTKASRESDENSAILLKGKEQPLSIEQLWKDYLVIESLASQVLRKYLNDLSINKKEDLSNYETAILNYFFKQSNINFITYDENKPIIDKNRLEIIINNLTTSENSEFTVHTKINKQELRNLIQLECSLFSQIPQDIIHWMNFVRLEVKKKNKYKFAYSESVLDESSKQIKKIEQKYKINPYKLFDFYVINMLIDTKSIKFENSDDLKKIREKILTLYPNNIEIIRKDYIQDVLKRYDLEKLIDLAPVDLILDEDLIIERTDKGEFTFIRPSNRIKKDNSQYKPKKVNPEWVQKAGKAHDELVSKLIDNSDLIEPDLELINSEYRFEDGWARADLLYIDSKGVPLVVEVKQNAIRNGNGFNNGLKAAEQTSGYKSAFQTRLNYCPLTRDQNLEVRGMLVAYNIDDNAKQALEKSGCEYKEIKLENVSKDFKEEH